MYQEEDVQLDDNGSAGLRACGGALIGRLRARRRHTHGGDRHDRVPHWLRASQNSTIGVGSWVPVIPLKRVPLQAVGDRTRNAYILAPRAQRNPRSKARKTGPFLPRRAAWTQAGTAMYQAPPRSTWGDASGLDLCGFVTASSL